MSSSGNYYKIFFLCVQTGYVTMYYSYPQYRGALTSGLSVSAGISSLTARRATHTPAFYGRRRVDHTVLNYNISITGPPSRLHHPCTPRQIMDLSAS